MGWQFCQIDKTRENAKKRVIVLVKDPFLFTGGGGTILLLYFLGYVFIFCRDTTKMVRYGNAEAQQNQYQYPRAHEKEQWSFLFFFVFLLWETIVMRLVKTNDDDMTMMQKKHCVNNNNQNVNNDDDENCQQVSNMPTRFVVLLSNPCIHRHLQLVTIPFD